MSRQEGVGYGRPPKSGQFKPGRSGNPRGRPKKEKPRPIRYDDMVSESLAEKELYRLLTLNENGRTTEIPAAQALIRSMMNHAIKGNRLQARYLVELIEKREKQALERQIEIFRHMKELRASGLIAPEQAEAREEDPPQLLPHPDDIVLDHSACTYTLYGPQDETELAIVRQGQRVRDCLLAKSELAHREGCAQLWPGTQFSTLEILAGTLDTMLPRRYRWGGPESCDYAFLLMELQNLGMKQLRHRLARQDAAIVAEAYVLPSLSPEIQQALNEVIHQPL